MITMHTGWLSCNCGTVFEQRTGPGRKYVRCGECRAPKTTRRPNRNRTICDDFGTIEIYRECQQCTSWKPLDHDHWIVRKRSDTGHVAQWDPECRACRRGRRRRDWSKRDPDERAARNRRLVEAVKADPVKLDRQRAQRRVQAKRKRQRDPEWERERARRYRAAVRADPKRMERQRESRRLTIAARVQAEGKQRPHLRRVHPKSAEGSDVPLGPVLDRVVRPALRSALLAAGVRVPDMTDWPAVQAAIREATAAYYSAFDQPGPMMQAARLAGTSERTIWGWMSGERKSIRMQRLDALLVASDKLWFEIYEPGDPGYELVRSSLGDG
jgi:hypothetical protein